MRAVMKNIPKYTVIVVLIVFAGACFAYPHAFWSATVAYSDFASIEENTYVDNQFVDSEKERFRSLLQQAKQRIEQNFGGYSSSPRIIFVSNPEKVKKFALGNAPAVTHITPWEQYIIIGPKTNSIDVIAHELFHAEIAIRLGYWAWQTKFPVWLNEGLAMQVDYRKQYLSDSKAGITHKQFNKVIALRKSSDFWRENKESNIRHYRLAKSAVTEILNNTNEGLYFILARIRAGEEPEAAFSVDKTNKALQRTSR